MRLKKTQTLVKRAGNFGKRVVVRITDDFQFGARMVARKLLAKGEGKRARLSCDAMAIGAPDQHLHRGFPMQRVAEKTKSRVTNLCAMPVRPACTLSVASTAPTALMNFSHEDLRRAALPDN